MVALAKHPLVDDFDLSSLRAILSGAAPLDSALQKLCAERLGAEVVQGYGLTETSPVTHTWRHGEPCTPGAVGMLLASTEARIVDPETTTDCDRGELWIRGPQVMAGISRMPKRPRRPSTRTAGCGQGTS